MQDGSGGSCRSRPAHVPEQTGRGRAMQINVNPGGFSASPNESVRSNNIRLAAKIVAGLTVLVLHGSLLAQASRPSRIPLTEIASIVERAKQIHTYWKTTGAVFPDQDKHVRIRHMPAPKAAAHPAACCSPWQGFDFTGILAVAP